MPPRRRKRIDPALFELPVDRIRAGTFSDAYFNSSRMALRAANRTAHVTWQLSAKNRYKGPVRTLEEIEEELEGTPPQQPEPPAAGPTPAPVT